MHYGALLALILFSANLKTDMTSAKRDVVRILSSETKILGQTNVNNFTCTAVQGNRAQHLKIFSRVTDKGIDFRDFLITLNVNEFDCGMKVMTKDFKSTIKGDEYPTIGLEIQSIVFNKGNGLTEGKSDAESSVKIRLAGQDHKEHIREGQLIKEGNTYIIKGQQSLNMTDFGLEPPSKFMGMVKVKDALVINFDITIEIIEAGTAD
ncbi:MAG: hypothetical protein OEV74_07265 [Cyclobacteriaceae bacterium]|nr:hypothetical protein [Cyclobacteriaceae bacterium]MDH4296059.1 hypothetical protein [Cyclobacteriaceae bacterium]MDH5248329.1 hypothetical protein [Cyclobacteriaceae bacterium]